MNDPIPTSSHGGWLVRSLLIVGVLGIILAAAWTVLLPGIVVSTVQARTGFWVKVDQLTVNPFTGVVNIEAAVVENPAGWPTSEFITLRRLKVDAELLPLLRRRLVADELIVDVEKLSLVRNKDGKLNSAVFRSGLAQAKTGSTAPPKPAGQQGGFLIRHLVVKFDRLIVADYSGKKPAIQEYDLKLVRDMRDVDSVAKIISPFLGSVLGAPGGLFEAGPGPVGEALNSLQQTGKKTGESLKKFFQSLEKKKP